MDGFTWVILILAVLLLLYIAFSEQRATCNPKDMTDSPKKMGSFIFNMATGENTWSKSLKVIMGKQPTSTDDSIATFWKHVYPKDVEIVKQGINEAVETGHLAYRYRAVLSDGTIKHMRVCGNVTYNSDGAPVMMSGFCVEE